jgi:hypothetical protein
MSSEAAVPHVCGAEAGDADAKMASDPDWQNPNLTGTAAPALTTFTTGGLSTGLKKPLKVHGTTVVDALVVEGVVEDVAIIVVVVVAKVVVAKVVVAKVVVCRNVTGPVSEIASKAAPLSAQGSLTMEKSGFPPRCHIGSPKSLKPSWPGATGASGELSSGLDADSTQPPARKAGRLSCAASIPTEERPTIPASKLIRTVDFFMEGSGTCCIEFRQSLFRQVRFRYLAMRL